MSGSRRRRSGSGGGGDSGWLTTYGDLVTLLLCFFIVLFSFSSLDIERFETLMAAFQGAIGVLDTGPHPAKSAAEGLSGQMLIGKPSIISELQSVMQRLDDFRRSQGIAESLTYDVSERGIVIHFTDRVLFDLGEAALRPEAELVLGRLADEVLRDWPNQIRVEGHTDSLPISNDRFPSNWELSTARAAQVVRFLVHNAGLDPSRMSAAGYAEYRPIASNAEPQGRSQNRRVDIVLLRTEFAASEPVAIFAP